MAIKAGVGLSKNKDSYQAGYEACKLALEKAGLEKPDLTIAFASSSFHQDELVRGIRDASGKAPLSGCTDAGEITNDGPTQKAVGVLAIKADNIKFFTGVGENIKKGAQEAGQAVARDIKNKADKAKESLRAFIMFPDVLTGNGADVVRGIQDVLGVNFPVLGGAAGDDFLFKQTFQYNDDEAATGTVGGIGLSGSFTMGAGVRHGWIPIGVPMKVTKSEGAVIHTLDNRPAISIYADYFGQKAEELRKEPLARTPLISSII